MNIEEVLKNEISKLNKNNIEDSVNKAKVLFAFILGVNKEYLIINNLEEVDEEKIKLYEEKINELMDGKPLQYITNSQEFMGLDFYVDENVLIPQPDTEVLVESVISIKKDNATILDLCTGSGAIAISIAKKLNNTKITASDISENAIKIATKNSIKNNVQEQIEFVLSDMFKNINGKFDIIVSNPPYIETDEIKKLSKEVQNEPHIALDGGNDGLVFYRIIANEGYKYLNKEGYIFVEIGYNQKESVMSLFEMSNKYKEIECIKDYSGNNRVIKCKLK